MSHLHQQNDADDDDARETEPRLCVMIIRRRASIISAEAGASPMGSLTIQPAPKTTHGLVCTTTTTANSTIDGGVRIEEPAKRHCWSRDQVERYLSVVIIIIIITIIIISFALHNQFTVLVWQHKWGGCATYALVLTLRRTTTTTMSSQRCNLPTRETTPTQTNEEPA